MPGSGVQESILPGLLTQTLHLRLAGDKKIVLGLAGLLNYQVFIRGRAGAV
jgi:hypothetical protein